MSVETISTTARNDELLRDMALLIERLQDHTRELEGMKRWMNGTTPSNQSEYNEITQDIAFADIILTRYKEMKAGTNETFNL